MKSPSRRFQGRAITLAVVIAVVLLRNQILPWLENPGQDQALPDVAGESFESAADPASSQTDVAVEGDALGFLTEVQPGEYRSPAGLMYRSGSADGHRLNHVFRHLRDDPEKVIHGVFEGSQRDVLVLIDQTYTVAQANGDNVRQRNQNDRTAWTVDLGRRVGYVGGEVGARDGHPECTFVTLVVSGQKDVITAYPKSTF